MVQGTGGARVRNVAAVGICAECSERFEYWTCGQRPKLCRSCSLTHAWCSGCKRSAPHGEFLPSQLRKGRCRECCTRPRVQYACGSCSAEFMGRRSRSAVVLCAECEQREKWCSRCDRVLPLDGFNVSREKRTGRVTHCRDCASTQNGTDEAKLRRNARKFGLTAAEWEAMRDAQDGVCAICKTLRGHKGLVVDHDHATGVVRALLCGPCNITLGLMLDEPERLRAAAEYLELHART